MNDKIISDKDLFNLVVGKGVQFMDLSYDVVPTREGYALRAINTQAQMVLFETYQTDNELVEALRTELETQMWAAITGWHTNVDTNWSYRG